jgi:hypothetical protein
MIERRIQINYIRHFKVYLEKLHREELYREQKKSRKSPKSTDRKKFDEVLDKNIFIFIF